MRTKKQSLKRLRSLSREQLHKLSEGFTIDDKKNPNGLFWRTVGIAVLWTITVIILSK